MKKKLCALLLGVIVVGTTFAGSFTISSNADNEETQVMEAVEEETEDQGLSVDTSKVKLTDELTEGASVKEVTKNAMPAIVAITNRSVQEVQSYYRGRGQGENIQYESESCGSGIIIGANDTELLICTNNHVVEDATKLTVSFCDESSYTATVKSADSSNDLAVVAVNLDDIDSDTLDAIRIARLGSSDDLSVGEQVVAIGNALGYGQSVTVGVVSALNRSIQVQDNNDVMTYENLIQTDAAINAGNSGGALLNMKGEVIGISSAKATASGVEGMGYAISVSKAEPILETLMNRQTRNKVDEDSAAYIGITGQSVTGDANTYYNIPLGVYVATVEEGGPAEEAGIQKGDVITAFDGISITGMSDLQSRLEYYSGGETVEITVATAVGGNYEEKTLTITLGYKNSPIA